MACLLVLLIACCLPTIARSLHFSQGGLPDIYGEASGISDHRQSQVFNEPDPDSANLGLLLHDKILHHEEEPITSLVSENELGFALHNQDSSISSLLEQNGLPIGLLPSCVESYTLSDDGQFSVSLGNVCYVDFDYEVYYAQTITGVLSYGTISELTGIQAKKAFFWVAVTGIHTDLSSGSYINFDIGPISKRLSISQFETVPVCKAKATDFRALQFHG